MVFKLDTIDNFSCLSAESEELAIFSKREYQVCGDNKLKNWLGMTGIDRMSMHLVPSDNLVCLPQRCVNETCGGCLQVSDLFSNKTTHKDKSKFGRTIDIECVLANYCGKKSVLSTLVDTEWHLTRVVTKGSIWLEKHRSMSTVYCFSSDIALR